MTTLYDFGRCCGTAVGHYLLGSHNFIVTALGSCVKWLITIIGTMGTLHQEFGMSRGGYLASQASIHNQSVYLLNAMQILKNVTVVFIANNHSQEEYSKFLR